MGINLFEKVSYLIYNFLSVFSLLICSEGKFTRQFVLYELYKCEITVSKVVVLFYIYVGRIYVKMPNIQKESFFFLIKPF